MVVGNNDLQFSFQNQYREDGVGLQSYDDKQGDQFIFTQFAATFSHYLFPNFDQPDLKAPWKLEMICPKEWEVVYNERPKIEHATIDSKGIDPFD